MSHLIKQIDYAFILLNLQYFLDITLKNDLFCTEALIQCWKRYVDITLIDALSTVYHSS